MPNFGAGRGRASRGLSARLGCIAVALVALSSPSFAAPADSEDAPKAGRFSLAIDALQIGSATARVRADWAFTDRLHGGLLLGVGRPPKDDLDDYELFEAGAQASWHLLGDRWRGVGAMAQLLFRTGSGTRVAQPADASDIKAQGLTAQAHVGLFGRYGSKRWPFYMELALLYGYDRSSGEAVQGDAAMPFTVSAPSGRASLYLGARF